jgi:hypothetical protein
MEVLIVLLLFIPLCKFLFRAVCSVLGFIGSIIGGLLQMIGGGMERKEAERRADRIATERAAREQRKIEDQARRIEAARLKEIERKERDLQREAREKERHEWMKERQEWARQKEQDRRQELEWKRQQRAQIEKERAEQKKADKTEQARRIAKVDLDFIDQSLSDLTPLVDQYRETFENTVTDKTKWNAYKKLYQLEARQNRLDKQRMKAIYTLQGGA